MRSSSAAGSRGVRGGRRAATSAARRSASVRGSGRWLLDGPSSRLDRAPDAGLRDESRPRPASSRRDRPPVGGRPPADRRAPPAGLASVPPLSAVRRRGGADPGLRLPPRLGPASSRRGPPVLRAGRPLAPAPRPPLRPSPARPSERVRPSPGRPVRARPSPARPSPLRPSPLRPSVRRDVDPFPPRLGPDPGRDRSAERPLGPDLRASPLPRLELSPRRDERAGSWDMVGHATGENDEERRPRGAALFERGFRRRPTLPGGLPPSTIGADRLNFRVRDGNGWDPVAMATGDQLSTNAVAFEDSRASTSVPIPSPRPIRTGRLNVLPRLHLRPINVMVLSRALLR